MVKEPAAHLFVAKKDIGRDAEMRAKHDLLVDRVDAEIDRLVRRRQRNRRAAPQDFARRARMDAGQELDERGLAGAVFADDGVNFALLKFEIDGFEGVRRAEPLVEFSKSEKGLGVGSGGWICRGHGRARCETGSSRPGGIIDRNSPSRKSALRDGSAVRFQKGRGAPAHLRGRAPTLTSLSGRAARAAFRRPCWPW